MSVILPKDIFWGASSTISMAVWLTQPRLIRGQHENYPQLRRGSAWKFDNIRHQGQGDILQEITAPLRHKYRLILRGLKNSKAIYFNCSFNVPYSHVPNKRGGVWGQVEIEPCLGYETAWKICRMISALIPSKNLSVLEKIEFFHQKLVNFQDFFENF